MMITIMTPTYNRSDLLKRLYKSLLKQNTQQFEWLIVDDGSIDNTKEVVNQWIGENKINIRYIYQSNSGKAVAFNKGVENARGELFLCVDSDDFLADNAVEIIIQNLDKIQKSNISGILALKQDIKKNILGDKLPKNIKYISTFDLSEKKHCRGEWTLVYKLSILRKFSFPVFENEKFVTENVLYDAIAKQYEMLLLDKVITICEYQEDGYTGNIVTNMLNNPTGYKLYYMQRIDMAYTWKKRMSYIIRYLAFRSMSKNDDCDYSGRYSTFVRMLTPIGYIGKLYYERRRSK